MNAAAPAQSFELISCERGLGRMLPQACARRHQLGNGSPSSIPPAARMQAAAIRNSPCRACPHGERRADGKSVAGEQLVTVRPAGDPAGASQHGSKSRVVAEQSRERALQLQSRPLVSEAEAVLIAPQHARARVEIEKRLTDSPVPAKAPTPAVAKGEAMPASSRPDWPACSECSKTFRPYANKRTCSPACSDARNSRLTNERQKAKHEQGEPLPLPANDTAIEPFAYTVRVRGLPVRCRTLADVVALVERFGEGV